jgi:hypothetical protein
MKVVLKGVRLAFPDLWEAKKFEGSDNARYGATFLVEPGSANDKAIREAIKTEATAAYAAKAPAMLKTYEGNSSKFCYLDGNVKDYDGFADMMYLSAHRGEKQGAPLVVDRNKQPLDVNSGKPYAGCYVNGSVDIYVQGGKFPGIRASLLAVQFFKDGDAFAGSRANPDDFEDLSEGADADEFGTADMI